MPKYWIITVSEENWQTTKTTNIYDAPETRISRSACGLIKPGDIIIFYVKKKGSKNFGGKFVDVFKAVSEWFMKKSPYGQMKLGRVGSSILGG